MADAAELRGGLKVQPLDHGGAKRYQVSNWSSPQDSFVWTLDANQAGPVRITALIRGKGSAVELSAGSKTLRKSLDCGWDRVDLGAVELSRGTNRIGLTAPQPGTKLELYSLEVVDPALGERLAGEARRVRSDTSWMRRAKYGVQFHWTSQSQPRSGPKKAYAEAVRDFPVEAFGRTVNETGAGYVILTTSHAEFYFPAPIAAIDAIMPGRTARRDLVRELVDELGKYGIRLILYFHAGHDHWREPDGWWVRSGFDPKNPETFLANWCAITSEVGRRYGSGLAGWFFDDGCLYYPLNPDFRRLSAAAKAGNPERVICYNPWIWPRFTDFQDYFCGEGYEFLKVTENLPADGSGIFSSGPQQGLQAHTNFILESNWPHDKADTPIPAPRIPKETFVRDMTQAIARGIVPSVNLEIYQNGGIGDASLEYMKALKAAVKAVRDKNEEPRLRLRGESFCRRFRQRPCCLRRPSDRARRRARASGCCGTASRRSAGWMRCRSGTDGSGRWSSAASTKR